MQLWINTATGAPTLKLCVTVKSSWFFWVKSLKSKFFPLSLQNFSKIMSLCCLLCYEGFTFSFMVKRFLRTHVCYQSNSHFDITSVSIFRFFFWRYYVKELFLKLCFRNLTRPCFRWLNKSINYILLLQTLSFL